MKVRCFYLNNLSLRNKYQEIVEKGQLKFAKAGTGVLHTP